MPSQKLTFESLLSTETKRRKHAPTGVGEEERAILADSVVVRKDDPAFKTWGAPILAVAVVFVGLFVYFDVKGQFDTNGRITNMVAEGRAPRPPPPPSPSDLPPRTPPFPPPPPSPEPSPPTLPPPSPSPPPPPPPPPPPSPPPPAPSPPPPSPSPPPPVPSESLALKHPPFEHTHIPLPCTRTHNPFHSLQSESESCGMVWTPEGPASSSESSKSESESTSSPESES